MAKHGWNVTMTHYDFDREVYAWRHEQSGIHYTLRIAQAVLEDTPAHVLGAGLDSLNVADLMKKVPRAYTLVRRAAAGVVVEQLPGPPGLMP